MILMNKRNPCFFYKQQKNSYRVATNPSLKQIDKFDKRYKYNILRFSYLDPQEKIKGGKTS